MKSLMADTHHLPSHSSPSTTSSLSHTPSFLIETTEKLKKQSSHYDSIQYALNTTTFESEDDRCHHPMRTKDNHKRLYSIQDIPLNSLNGDNQKHLHDDPMIASPIDSSPRLTTHTLQCPKIEQTDNHCVFRLEEPHQYHPLREHPPCNDTVVSYVKKNMKSTPIYITKKHMSPHHVCHHTSWNSTTIEMMSQQTDKTIVLEILDYYATAHKKHVYLFHRLRSTILRHLPQYTAADLANICHSFVVLGFLNEEFVQAMSPRVIATAHLCTSIELTHLLDAYASLRLCLTEPLKIITDLTFQHLSEFSIGDLMTHASSFARLNIHNYRLFSMIAQHIQDTDKKNKLHAPQSAYTHQRQHRGQDQCHIGTSLLYNPDKQSNRNHTEQQQQQYPGLLISNSHNTQSHFTARDLTLAAYSFAKLGFYFLSVFKFVSKHAKKVIRDFTAHQIQMVAVAFQKAGIRDIALYHELSIQAQRRMAQFNAESIALLLRSFSLFDIRDEPLFTRVVAQLPRLILTFRPLDIATTLNAFARLNIISSPLLSIVMPYIMGQRNKFAASDFQSVLHAFARLGSIHSEFLTLFITSCDLCQLTPSQLVLVVIDMGRLGVRDVEFLNHLQTIILSKINVLNMTMIIQIYTTYLFLRLYEYELCHLFITQLESQIKEYWDKQKKILQYIPTHTVKHYQPQRYSNTHLPSTCYLIPLNVATTLCLIEFATLLLTHTTQLPPNTKINYLSLNCFPIPPDELLFHILNNRFHCVHVYGSVIIKLPTLLNFNNLSVVESVTNQLTLYHTMNITQENLEHLLFIRAILHLLPTITIQQEIQMILHMLPTLHISVGNLSGCEIGFPEQETDYAINTISTMLYQFIGIKNCTMYPRHMSHNTMKLNQDSILYKQSSSIMANPIIPHTIKTSIDPICPSSPLKINEQISTTLSDFSFTTTCVCHFPNNDQSEVSELNTTRYANILMTDQSMKRLFDHVPYHSFITFPKSELSSFFHWIPKPLLSCVNTQQLFFLSSSQSTDKDYKNFQKKSHLFYQNSSGYSSDSDMGSPIDIVTIDHLLLGYGRTRSQSDSIIYYASLPQLPTLIKDRYSSRNKNNFTLSSNQYTSHNSQNIKRQVLTSNDALQCQSVGSFSQTLKCKQCPQIDKSLSHTNCAHNDDNDPYHYSDKKNQRHLNNAHYYEKSVNPSIILVWGGTLHYFYNKNVLNHFPSIKPMDMYEHDSYINYISEEFDNTTESEFWDAYCDDHEIEITREILTALSVYKDNLSELTTMAKIQVNMLSTFSTQGTSVYLIPHFVWSMLHSFRTRCGFLALLLLNPGNIMEYTK